MAARLEQAFQNIREFTLHASHELKTPLTIIAGYLDANSVETETTLATLKPDSPHRWDLTMTIKICVLVRSELPVVSDAASAKYVPCFANPPDPVDAPDLRLRRTYYSTVVMRNRLQPNTTFPL